MAHKQDLSIELDILYCKHIELQPLILSLRDNLPNISGSSQAALQEAADLIDEAINLLQSINH